MKKSISSFMLTALVLMRALDAKSGVDSRSEPLFIASKEGDVQQILTFIQEKTDLNIKNKEGVTPLMTAVRAGKLEVAEILIDNGADVNAQLKDGETALHIAIQNEDKALIKLLLENKATITRPFSYALTLENFRAASAIYEHYLNQAIDKGNPEEVKELLELMLPYKQLLTLSLDKQIERVKTSSQIANKKELLALLQPSE